MAGWHVVEKYLEQTGKHSTLIGKYWITMFLVLRLLILFSICEAAFGDVDLECDTKTPGCEKMCINQFYPIAPGTYWGLQMLFVSLPIMIFMVYCSHKQEKIVIARKLKKTALTEQKEATKKEIQQQIEKLKDDRETLARKKDVAEQLYETPHGKRITGRDLDKMFADEEERLHQMEQDMLGQLDEEEKQEDDNKDDKATKSSGKDNSTPPKLFLGYAAMVFTRTLVEVGFIAGYFYIYVWKWVMPETYKCNREPCNNEVTCYVERPKQKTLVIWIMFATGCITIFVGLMELWSLGLGKISNAWQHRHNDITKEYKVGRMSAAHLVAKSGYVPLPGQPAMVPVMPNEKK